MVYNILNYAHQGNQAEMEQATASFVGGMVAGRIATIGATALIGKTAIAVSLGGFLTPIAASLAIGTLVSWGIDYYYEQKQCKEKHEKDPAQPFQPQPDETPEKDYHKKYYDPIILDLNGNGVGTVAKFGVLFMINGGAMFDHDGDGIATRAGWVAVNDEWWEMVV